MSKLKNTSIYIKILIPLIIISLLLISIAFTLNNYFSNNRSNASAISLLEKNINLYTYDNEVRNELELNKILSLFQSSIDLLKNGGEYLIDGNTYKTYNATEQQLKKINKIEKIWSINVKALKAIVNLKKHDNTTKTKSLKLIDENSVELLKLNNELVDIYINNNIQNSKSTQLLLQILLLILFILLIIIFITSNIVILRLKKLLKLAESLSEGNVINTVKTKVFDEVGKVINAIHSVSSNIEKATQFSIQIGARNYDVDYKAEKGDKIGESLVNMQTELINADKLRLIRDKEEKQRSWTTTGFAKFGDILRNDNDDIDKLSNNILSNLIKYVNANQGGFFLINNEDEKDEFIDLISSYAYDRKKFSEKRIEFGNGLVGTCILERKTILLTDIPDNYVNITSGLGDSNPRCIILVPLKLNENIIGVIELATFKIFEDFEVEFIEKVAESIASTMISVKTNLKTKELLSKSQEQSEDLAQKEEELISNLDELRETQEKAIKQGEEFEVFTNAVNHTMIRAEYDPTGLLTYANTKFIEKLGYDISSDIMGKDIISFIDPIDKDGFKKEWYALANGGSHFEGDVKHTKKDGADIWLMSTYVCKRKADGTIDSILFLATDITEKKEENLSDSAQIEAINLSSMKVEFYSNGKIAECNEKFLSNLGFELNEILSLKISDLVSQTHKKEFETEWASLFEGHFYKGVMQFTDKDGNDKWFQGAASTVKDYHKKVKKIIYIATDVTEQKLMEIETLNQSKILKQQDEQLRESQNILEQKLEEARNEMKEQFKEIETTKIRNELTLEGMVDAILTFNDSGKIIFFNKAAEDLWGYTKSDVVNENISKLFSDETIKSDDFVGKMVDNTKEKYISIRQEVSIFTADKDESSVLMLISEANIKGSKTYTAFVQSIEMELF